MKNVNFITLLNAELLKYRKSPALFLTLGAPLFLASVVFLIFFFKADKIIANPELSMEKYFGNSLNFLSLLIPMFLILLNIFVFNLEYKSNAFKSLFSLPVKRKSVILSKFMAVVLMFFCSIVALQCLLYLGFHLNAIKYPKLFNFDSAFFLRSCLALLQMTGVSLAILSLQFYFSFKWKNVVVSISLGMIGILSYLILINGWQYIIYHPYAFPTLSLEGLKSESDMMVNQLWYSLLGAFIILGFILWETKRKKIVD